MSKTVVIVLAVLGGSCLLCGGSLALLGLAQPPSVAPAAPSVAPALTGDHPAELVGFWSCDASKLALFHDGTAKKWIRHSWNGSITGNTCRLEGDLVGTWAAHDGTLELELTEGRWVDCRGEQAFQKINDAYGYRFTFASGIGKKVMWLRDAHGESGYNLECAAPAGCNFEPKPIP